MARSANKEPMINSFLDNKDLSLFRKLLLTMLHPGVKLKDKKAVDLDEAAALLGVGRSTIQKLINNGKLKSFKVETRRLIRMETIDEFILNSEEGEYYGR